MRKTAVLLVSLILGFILDPVFAQETPADIKDRFGIYHWDGTYLAQSDNPLLEGAVRAKEGGYRVINVVVMPEWDYKLGKRFESSNLTLRARRADYVSVLSDPYFSTIVITAFDWASYPKKYLNLPANSAERVEILNRISAEFSDFVFHLAQICRNQNKTFIIKDWEVENNLGIKTSTPDQPLIDQNKWNDYLDYIVAKQKGVAEGKKLALQAGIELVRFYNAVETANIYPLFLDKTKENSVLWQMVQKNIKVDLVSLSGWQPIWGADPLNIYLSMKAALWKVVDFIQTNGIAQKMFLGEAGILDSYNPELLRYIYDAVEENPDVLLMVKWNLYNIESAGWLGVFGNYDASGRITPQGLFTNELLNGRLPKIGGVINGASHENQIQPGDIIEIYGQNFPEEISHDKVLLALGDSKYIEAEVLYASPTQINARIPNLPELSGKTVFVKVNNSNFKPIFIGTPGM